MRKKLLVALCVVSLLLLAEICVFICLQNSSEKGISWPWDAGKETAAGSETAGSNMTDAPENETAEETAPAQPEASGDPAQGSATKPAADREPVRQQQIPKPPKPVPTEPAPEPIEFPYQVPGTTLEIRSIAAYDGLFLEDGSDREISAVAAAIICNVGDMPVEYAQIQLEGGQLTFVVTALNAQSIAIVQEMNGTAYASRDWYECSADVAYMESMELSERIVKINENEDGTLSVANISGERIPCLRIFYKFYMEDQNAYVGGITYNVKILNLDAGQSQTVTPSHYIPGYSRIVMVKNYDEEN